MKSHHKYGLIGKSLSHSFSQNYFHNKFKQLSLINYQYDNYELINESKLSEFIQKNDCIGLNVTIPYKEAVIPYLTSLDSIAKSVKAVNTIKYYKDGSSKGFNTDVIGFKRSLEAEDLSPISKALILGDGGASKAVQYALELLNIKFEIVGRKEAAGQIKYESLSPQYIQNTPLIINCTPLGMWPKTKDHPPIPYDAITKNHLFFDLIYQPAKTVFLELAEKQGAKTKNGLEMLQLQADAAWEIWQDDTI